MVKGRFYIEAFAHWAGDGQNDACDVSFLPPVARRRLSAIDRIALHLVHAVRGGRTQFPLVYASRFGAFNRVLGLLDGLRENAEVSPNGFSASVHNSGCGTASVGLGNKCAYTALSGGADTIESALAEAASRKEGDLLFCYADTPPAIPTDSDTTGVELPCGFAFFATEELSERTIAVLEVLEGCKNAGPIVYGNFVEGFLEKKRLFGSLLALDFK